MAVRKKAGSTGRALWKKVTQKLDQIPAGVTVFSGDDEFHLLLTWKALLAASQADDSQMAVNVIQSEGTKVPIDKVLSEARAIGMFSPKKYVFVPDGAKLDGDLDALKAYAMQPPTDSYLFIRAAGLDKRKKLAKVLYSTGVQLEFNVPDTKNGDAWLALTQELAEERGFTLEPKAAGFLAAISEGSIQRIDAEIEKLSTFLEPGTKKVSFESLRDVVSGSVGGSIWIVADALLERNLGKAVGEMRRLVDEGEEPLMLLGGLASRARAMVQAAGLRAARTPSREIVNRVRAWYFQNQLFSGLDKYSEEELLAFPGHLLEADRTLKSRSIQPGAVMEALLERMIAGR